MRRFMLVLAGAASVLTTAAGPAAAQAPSESCVPASTATYRHSFNGAAGRSTITPLRRLCPGGSQTFSLVAYTAPAPSAPGGLFAYDVSRATLTSGKQSVTLKVSVPSCHTHVYAVTGAAAATETTTPAAIDSRTVLGSPQSRSTGPAARHIGGDSPCVVAPTVAFRNSCDRTFTATVTNAETATVAATLSTNGRLIRVAPGRSTTLKARAGSTLTFRASNFTTYVGTWRSPTTPCTTAPTPSPAPTTPPPLPVTPVAASALLPPPATFPATSALAAAPEPPSFTTAPASLTPTRSAGQQARTGMSAGSMIAIALGFLLMGGGALMLTRLLKAAR